MVSTAAFFSMPSRALSSRSACRAPMIRQMSQPLGVAVAALAVPHLAEAFGIWAPLALAGLATAVLAAACAVWIADPPRPAVSGVGVASAPGTKSPVLGPDSRSDVPSTRANPYRGDHFLARIHLLSVFLVVPQFTLSTFGLVWLITGLGWSATAAGAVIALSQFVGAVGRILVGHLSDRVGSRVRVLRWVAVSGVVAMLSLAALDALDWSLAAAAMMMIAATISVADNGLSYTSVAEVAGPSWSGKALGVQNTGQFIAASAVGPGIGALVTAVGYPATFALVALAPLAAWPLVPPRDQHRGASGVPEPDEDPTASMDGKGEDDREPALHGDGGNRSQGRD